MIQKYIFFEIYFAFSLSMFAFCTKQPGSGQTNKANVKVGKKTPKPIKYIGPMPPDFVAFCSVNGIETYCDWLESLEGDIDKCIAPETLEKSADYNSVDYCAQGMMRYFVELDRGMWLYNIHPQSKSFEDHFIFTICCLPGAIPPFSLLPIEETKLVKCYNDPKKFHPWLLSLSWCGVFVSNDPKDFDVPITESKNIMKKLCCIKPGNGICISTDCNFYAQRNTYYKDTTLIDLAAKENCEQPQVINTGEKENYTCEGKLKDHELEKYELQLCFVDSKEAGKNKIWKLEDYDLKCEEKEEYFWCHLNTREKVKGPLEYEHISSMNCNEIYEFVTCCKPGWFPTHMLPLDENELYKDYDPKTFLPWIVKKHVRSTDL